MASSAKSNRAPERIISCPFNKAHQIAQSRMQTHLVRCRKDHEGELIYCPYNTTHMVADPEFMHHLENCPDRIKIDRMLFQTTETLSKRFPIQQFSVDTEESWDNVSVPSYDPDMYCATNPVLRQAKVKSAAQKRNLRAEERQRHQRLGAVKAELAKSSKETASEFSIRNPPSVCTDSELEQPEEDGPVDVCELLERVKLEGLAAQAIVKAMNDQTYSDDDSDPEPEVPEYKRMTAYKSPVEANRKEKGAGDAFTLKPDNTVALEENGNIKCEKAFLHCSSARGRPAKKGNHK